MNANEEEENERGWCEVKDEELSSEEAMQRGRAGEVNKFESFGASHARLAC